jgi:AraC-like DNA-binding protein
MSTRADSLATVAAVDAAEPSSGSLFDSPKARVPVLTRVTSDIDGYRKTLPGVELRMVRGGPDQRPSTARCVQSDLGVVVGAVEPGCKTICHTHLERDRLSMSYVLAAAPGTTWCGNLDMAAGMSVIHQPDAEHTAINLPGTRFAFAILDVDAVVERSEVLEVPLQPWHLGDVDVKVSGDGGGAASILTHLASAPIESIPARLLDDLLTAATLSLSNPDVNRRVRAPTSVSSRKVVGDCIDFAEAIGREPSIAEMCLASHVSDRRLRQAFHDTFQVSPKRYFRHWVLCQAHDRLLAGAPDDTSVTYVATGLGLSHLGRFSTQYHELHGECPSTTLRRSSQHHGFPAGR